MIIRRVRNTDIDKMYKAFKKSSFNRENLRQQPNRKNGFYEYSLTYPEFLEKANSPLTLVCEDKGGILAYTISYDIDFAQGLQEKGINDSVLNILKEYNDRVVYLDQLYLKPSVPLSLGARVLDLTINEAEKRGAPGIVAVIAQKPWKNIGSTRLATAQGFRRTGLIKKDGVTLGIYERPILLLNSTYTNRYGNESLKKNF